MPTKSSALTCALSAEAHASRVLSSARKLSPAREAVVLRILACLAFLACASVHLVAHAELCARAERPRSSTDLARTQTLGSSAAALERLHEDATPVDDPSATEAEQPEKDAALGALPFRLTTRLASIARFASPAVHAVCASEWPAQPLRSAVMAQGPP